MIDYEDQQLYVSSDTNPRSLVAFYNKITKKLISNEEKNEEDKEEYLVSINKQNILNFFLSARESLL